MPLCPAQILSRDENDAAGPVLSQRVEEVFVRTGRVWVLTLDGRAIRTTSEHPFFAEGHGWKPLAELAVGDRLLGESGDWLTIEALEDTGRYETVYNLRVSESHTYFIGEVTWGFSVWAHNANNHYVSELGTGEDTKAHSNNPRGKRDAIEHAVNGERGRFEQVLAQDGINDPATVQRLWDAARRPLDTEPGEVGRVGPERRLRVTPGDPDLGDPAGSVRITHPTEDDFLLIVPPTGEATAAVGYVNSRGTHNELLDAAVGLTRQQGATSLTYNSGPLNENSGSLLTRIYNAGRAYLGGGPLQLVSEIPLVYQSDMTARLNH